MKKDVFDLLKSPLDKPYNVLDGTFKPQGPAHWLKEFLDSDADVFYLTFTIDDNPFLSADFVANLKKEYTGVFYRRFILGEWCSAEGLVYPMFDKEIHTFEKIPEVVGVEDYYISVDYGTLNPCSMGLWRIDGR